MRAVLRKAVVCALLAAAAGGAQTLDEAVRALAKKVTSRLAPADVPRVTVRLLANLSGADAATAKTTFERAIRRPAPRSPKPLDLALTLSQNLRGYLLVADFERDGERVVEMVGYRPRAAAPPAHAVIERQMLWEQDDPMLDLAMQGDAMYVLEPAALVTYLKRGGSWERGESQPIERPALRDPRGRIEFEAGEARAVVPGLEGPFSLDGEAVRFSLARNTLEAAGRAPFFSLARLDGLWLVAETDGRLHAYETDGKTAGAFETWGSDLVSVPGGCATAIVSSPTERDASDALIPLALADRKPVAVGEPLPFSGPITALWPAPGGAVAIARNSVTGRYAAYSVSIRCSR